MQKDKIRKMSKKNMIKLYNDRDAVFTSETAKNSMIIPHWV